MKDSFSRLTKVVLIAAAMLLGTISPAHAQNDGAALYKAKCAMCHGPDGKGDTVMGKTLKVHDLASADVQKQTDAQLAAVIHDGAANGKMPAYKDKLSDAQIKDLVAFIRTLAKK
jgi:cytochrome c6